ncbi:MAG: SDR family oxidoreductase [Bacteroidales bacterium]|nr:SDR family oxidoreductase [Bacteroidales bacterium]
MKNYTLITGASGGIGYELALLFARDNHNLILIARSKDKLENLKTSILKETKIDIIILAEDLSIPGVPEKIFKEIQAKTIVVDMLINNAGFGDYGYFKDCDINKQEKMINLNILALTKLTKLFLPALLERKTGKILNIASTAAFQPGPLMSVYFASKAYVLSFSSALAFELRDSGITVTTLCPGPTQTGFSSAAAVTSSKMFNPSIPSAKEVALFGYKKMMKGKTLAIHGFKNRFQVFLLRFTPRNLIAAMVYYISK